jgi:ADP-ribosyl-[dinitrogen reductase] hydrolase
MSLKEKISGGLIGLLVGDALGVPYEFHKRDEIPALAEIEFTPPPGFRRSHDRVPPGTWSDDGAHALTLLASLLERGTVDLDDLGSRMIAWYDSGYKAVDGKVFDVGIQTGQAINRLARGVPADEAGSSDVHANGNGSLMRVLPLALWHKGSVEEMVADAQKQSLITHGHLCSQVCCALYCLWARYTLSDSPDAWQEAVTSLRAIYAEGSKEQEELEWSIRPDDPLEGTGSGYVVDCLRSARWALQAGEYEHVVKAAVSLGNDTDTTACVAGGIAGLRDGINAIPERWRNALRGKELFEDELRLLIEWRSKS